MFSKHQAHATVLQQLRVIAVRGLLFATFLSFFVSVLHLAVPLFMLQVYDRVISSRSLDTLTALAAITLAALVLYGVLEFIRGRTYHVLGNNLSARLSMPVIRGAIRDAAGGGRTSVTQAMRDLMDLRNFVSGNALGVILDLLWSPLFLLVLWLLHPSYVLVGLAAAAVLVGVGIAGSLATRPSLDAAAARAGETYRELGQSMGQSEAIEAMGMSVPLSRRWCDEHARLTSDFDRAGALGKAFTSASRALRLSVQVLVLALGAYLVINRQVSPGTMMAASIIMGRLLHPFEQVVESWRTWVFARQAYGRIDALLAASAREPEAMPLPRPAGRVVAEKLGYFPPGTKAPVLRDVSFTLEAGEVLGVIGASGAGKSTLARAIVGVITPTTGGVYLDDHATHTWERGSFGEHVGYLPQGVALLDGSIRANIARMGEGTPERVVEAARAAGIHDVIGHLDHGYETRIGPGGMALSGGQLQRIGLARALYDSPALLVLDEPNSNLDGEGEMALDRVIRRAKAVGTTVVIIAHRPSAVAQADKLLVLNAGQVEHFGTKQEVLQAGKAQSLGIRGVPSLRSASART